MGAAQPIIPDYPALFDYSRNEEQSYLRSSVSLPYQPSYKTYYSYFNRQSKGFPRHVEVFLLENTNQIKFSRSYDYFYGPEDYLKSCKELLFSGIDTIKIYHEQTQNHKGQDSISLNFRYVDTIGWVNKLKTLFTYNSDGLLSQISGTNDEPSDPYSSDILPTQDSYIYDSFHRLIRIDYSYKSAGYGVGTWSSFFFQYASDSTTLPSTINDNSHYSAKTLTNIVYCDKKEDSTNFILVGDFKIQYAKINYHLRDALLIDYTYGFKNSWVYPSADSLTSYLYNDVSLDLKKSFYRGRVWSPEGLLLKEYEIGAHPYYGRDTIKSTRMRYTFNNDGTMKAKTFEYMYLKNNLTWETEYSHALHYEFSAYENPLVTDLGTFSKEGKQYILEVFPNPAKEQVNFHGIPNGEECTVELYSTDGRLVKHKSTTGSGYLSIQGLAPGYYLFKIKSANKQQTFSIALE